MSNQRIINGALSSMDFIDSDKSLHDVFDAVVLLVDVASSKKMDRFSQFSSWNKEAFTILSSIGFNFLKRENIESSSIHSLGKGISDFYRNLSNSISIKNLTDILLSSFNSVSKEKSNRFYSVIENGNEFSGRIFTFSGSSQDGLFCSLVSFLYTVVTKPVFDSVNLLRLSGSIMSINRSVFDPLTNSILSKVEGKTDLIVSF